jgi:hypothetical protein
MSKTMYKDAQIMEVKGHIPQGSAFAFTMASIYEAAVRKGLEGYYGTKTVSDAFKAAKTDASLAGFEQLAMDVQSEMFADVQFILKTRGGIDAFMKQNGFGASHSTSDFPKALAALRTARVRQGDSLAEANWRGWIPSQNILSVPDFKMIRGVKPGLIGELKKRAELEDVEYTTMDFTSDGYFVANYERAIEYSWEMWRNDEFGRFVQMVGNLGISGRRTEILVILGAILSGVARSVEAGVTTGAPTITNVGNARTAISRRTAVDPDGVSQELELMATDILYGIQQKDAVEATLSQRTVDGQIYSAANPNLGLVPHLERPWNRILGSDWLLFDNTRDWIEVAFLQDFEGGPLFYTKAPSELDHPDQGSFDNHAFAIKAGHTLGSKVTDANGAIRVQGA